MWGLPQYHHSDLVEPCMNWLEMRPKRTFKSDFNSTSLLLAVLLFVVFTSVTVESSSPAVKTMAPELQEEYCKNFTYGNPVTKEFFSPGFPRNYPAGIKCFRTISADYGYFVRVDFRDYFNIEPPTNEGNCAYDYLEVSHLWW